MRIVAVTNIKGGVGKTTTAVNLAYLCAAGGRSTALWDLDPQGAATWLFGVEPEAAVSAKQLVGGKVDLAEIVARTAYERLDLLPADLSYRNLDLHINERKHRTQRLLRMTRSLAERYEFLFLDCPPGISLLSENVIRAADMLVVPMLPAPLSLRMLEQLRAFVAGEGWSDVRIAPFFSMVDRRKSLHADVVVTARTRFPEIAATEVPYWSDIERMSVRRAPVPAFAPRSAAAQVYAALWAELCPRLYA
jgi:cellulose biosynthesis protein BcsQ